MTKVPKGKEGQVNFGMPHETGHALGDGLAYSSSLSVSSTAAAGASLESIQPSRQKKFSPQDWLNKFNPEQVVSSIARFALRPNLWAPLPPSLQSNLIKLEEHFELARAPLDLVNPKDPGLRLAKVQLSKAQEILQASFKSESPNQSFARHPQILLAKAKFYQLKGQVAELEDQPGQARQAYEAAKLFWDSVRASGFRLSPKDWESLGRVLVAVGEYEEAGKIFLSLELNPRAARSLFFSLEKAYHWVSFNRQFAQARKDTVGEQVFFVEEQNLLKALGREEDLLGLYEENLMSFMERSGQTFEEVEQISQGLLRVEYGRLVKTPEWQKVPLEEKVELMASLCLVAQLQFMDKAQAEVSGIGQVFLRAQLNLAKGKSLAAKADYLKLKDLLLKDKELEGFFKAALLRQVNTSLKGIAQWELDRLRGFSERLAKERSFAYVNPGETPRQLKALHASRFKQVESLMEAGLADTVQNAWVAVLAKESIEVRELDPIMDALVEVSSVRHASAEGQRKAWLQVALSMRERLPLPWQAEIARSLLGEKIEGVRAFYQRQKVSEENLEERIFTNLKGKQNADLLTDIESQALEIYLDLVDPANQWSEVGDLSLYQNTKTGLRFSSLLAASVLVGGAFGYAGAAFGTRLGLTFGLAPEVAGGLGTLGSLMGTALGNQSMGVMFLGEEASWESYKSHLKAAFIGYKFGQVFNRGMNRINLGSKALDQSLVKGPSVSFVARSFFYEGGQSLGAVALQEGQDLVNCHLLGNEVPERSWHWYEMVADVVVGSMFNMQGANLDLRQAPAPNLGSGRQADIDTSPSYSASNGSVRVSRTNRHTPFPVGLIVGAKDPINQIALGLDRNLLDFDLSSNQNLYPGLHLPMLDVRYVRSHDDWGQRILDRPAADYAEVEIRVVGSQHQKALINYLQDCYGDKMVSLSGGVYFINGEQATSLKLRLHVEEPQGSYQDAKGFLKKFDNKVLPKLKTYQSRNSRKGSKGALDHYLDDLRKLRGMAEDLKNIDDPLAKERLMAASHQLAWANVRAREFRIIDASRQKRQSIFKIKNSKDTDLAKLQLYSQKLHCLARAVEEQGTILRRHLQPEDFASNGTGLSDPLYANELQTYKKNLEALRILTVKNPIEVKAEGLHKLPYQTPRQDTAVPQSREQDRTGPLPAGTVSSGASREDGAPIPRGHEKTVR